MYQHGVGVGDDTAAIDDVDERLLHGDLLDAAHVKAVHVVPPVDLRLLVLSILDAAQVEGSSVGEDETARFLCAHTRRAERVTRC